MWFELFLRGIIVGLAASIPLGPVAILCIQRTLSKSLRSGFSSGLGVATADTIYSTIALFSLSMVTSFLDKNEMLFQIIGGLCIGIVGLNIFLTNPNVQIRRNRANEPSMLQDYASALLITLANPAIILIHVTLFATFGLSSSMGYVNGVAMLLGVMTGGAAWWFVLTFCISLLRRKFKPVHLLWMNRISGSIIATLGMAAVLSVLFNITLDDIF